MNAGSDLIDDSWEKIQLAEMNYEAAEIAASESGVVRVPDNHTPITEAKVAGQLMKLIDTIEDLDDVENIYHNAEIDDEIMEQLSSD